MSSNREARHSVDFRSISINGLTLQFTVSQAAIVRVLWENAENGTPCVGGAALLAAADSDMDRGDIGPLFYRHPHWHLAWGRFLKRARRGVYYLDFNAFALQEISCMR